MNKDYRNYLRQDEIETQIKKIYLNTPKTTSWNKPSTFNANYNNSSYYN